MESLVICPGRIVPVTVFIAGMVSTSAGDIGAMDSGCTISGVALGAALGVALGVAGMTLVEI
jgi:hypothetical protein